MKSFLAAAASLAILVAARPAGAQGSEPPVAPEALPYHRNTITIGVGGAWLPSYEGSDDYSFSPVALAFGRIGGHSFATRGTGLYISLVATNPNDSLSFDFGPAANLRLDRSRDVHDRQVAALGKIGPAVELGGYAGLTKNRVLHAYDSLGARVAVTHDVTDTHGSTIVTPSIDYTTPLSTRTAVNLSLSAERVGRGYGQTYFSVDAAGAVRSGLPAYSAGGGWKNMRASLLLGQVLAGDLRNPRISLFAGASYARELGTFRRSPIVAIAGSPDQYLATAGLAYTF